MLIKTLRVRFNRTLNTALPWGAFRWRWAQLKPISASSSKRRWSAKRLKEALKTAHGAHRGEADLLQSPPGFGKVTDCGNDRLNCLYTSIPARFDCTLEAEVTVTAFLREPGPSNREAFGVFIRDTMSPDPATGEYYSNLAAVGGYYGRYNFYGRDGVVPDDIERVRNFFLYPRVNERGGAFAKQPLRYRIGDGHSVRIRLSLQKRGDCMIARMTGPDGSDLLSPARNGGPGEIAISGNVAWQQKDYTVSLPGAFRSRKPSRYYLGFLTADGSAMRIHKDTVRITLTKAMPSAARTSEPDRAFPVTVAPVSDISTGSPRPVEQTWIAAPDGAPNGAGTETSPLDAQTAISRCRPGDTVLLKKGLYLPRHSLCVEKINSGTPDRRMRLVGESAGAVIDFQNTDNALCVRGDHWDISGLSVTRGHGIILEGSGNRLQNCRAFRNLETGILIRHPDITSPRDAWPHDNLVEDCVSFENRDAAECNADGFACKVAAGGGNRFRRCVSWLNSDDGFDLFTKNRKIGGVLIEDCRSYLNGYKRAEDGSLVATVGNGNGFKLGGSGLRVDHEVVGSVAAANRQMGFTSNSNPAMRLRQCAAYNNQGANCYYYYYLGSRVVPEKEIVACDFDDKDDFSANALLAKLTSEYET